jgi:hypothetical protein
MIKAIVILLLTACTLTICRTAPTINASHSMGVTLNLPDKITGFSSVDGKPDKVELESLPTDTQFAKKTYYTENAADHERDIARVSIVLAGAQSRSIHRPEVCLVGQGWTIIDSKVIPISIGNRVLQVKDLTIERLNKDPHSSDHHIRAHYAYWLVGADVSTPSHLERMWLSTWDNVFRNINHRWAYPSITVMVTENLSSNVTHERQRTDEQTMNLITHLIQTLVPTFQKSFQ